MNPILSEWESPVEYGKEFVPTAEDMAWWILLDCTGDFDCPAPSHIEGCFNSLLTGKIRKTSVKAELDRRKVHCDTCGGLGWIVEDQSWDQPDGEQHQCPDVCLDGRHTFQLELNIPCPDDTDGDGDCAWCSKRGQSHIAIRNVAIIDIMTVYGKGALPDETRFPCIQEIFPGEYAVIENVEDTFGIPAPDIPSGTPPGALVVLAMTGEAST